MLFGERFHHLNTSALVTLVTGSLRRGPERTFTMRDEIMHAFRE